MTEDEKHKLKDHFINLTKALAQTLAVLPDEIHDELLKTVVDGAKTGAPIYRKQFEAQAEAKDEITDDLNELLEPFGIKIKVS